MKLKFGINLKPVILSSEKTYKQIYFLKPYQKGNLLQERGKFFNYKLIHDTEVTATP